MSFSMRTALLLIMLAVAIPTFACTCAGFGPACTEAVSERTSAIFLGTVEAITPLVGEQTVPDRAMSANRAAGLVEVKFRVQETYKGASAETVRVRTNASEAACGFPFEKGEQYVVYASEQSGVLYTSICDRTLPARLVTKDLDYLRALRTLPNTAQIFGSYKRYTFDPNFVPKFTPSIMDHYLPPEEEYEAMAPMTGETVTVKSDSGAEWHTKINQEGRFSIDGLPPGTYRVAVTTPQNFALAEGYVSGFGFRFDAIKLTPKGCAEVTFRTRPDGHIAGKIVNTDGRPLGNVQVMVWNVGQEFNLYKSVLSVYNNEDGTFDVAPLPPGKYILGAYVWVLHQGFPAMANDRERLTQATLHFYPGTTRFADGKAISVDLGQHVSGITLEIPFDPTEWKDVESH
jgi:hypothetical protein